MRNRKQNGQIVRIGDRWYVRYWERRNIGGTVERKRVTHHLGSVTTRGKRPPADIEKEAERHMATVNGGAIPAERIVTIGDFVERIYLPWIEQHKRPSTAKGYRDIWEDHLKPHCAQMWLKDTRTYHVQGWLNQIGKGSLSRNTLKHIKSVVSAIFTLAKQQDYFHAENPARDTAINPGAAEPQETYAYSLEEIQSILARLPEPAGTAFAIAAFMGLRYGEIRGLLWENYHDEEMHVISLHLEWPDNGPKDAQRARSGSCNSAVSGTARNASAALRQSSNRPDLRQCAWQAACDCHPHESVHLAISESLRTLRETGVSSPEGESRISGVTPAFPSGTAGTLRGAALGAICIAWVCRIW